MTREVTKSCAGVRVMLSRATRAGYEALSPGSYGGWEEAPWLIARVIEERIAPAHHRAKFTLDLARAPGAPLRAWRQPLPISADDRVAVVNRADDTTLFLGFLLDADLTWTQADESVVVTAASYAYRLARDRVVYGRWMVPSGTPADPVHYSGLPCRFNPGGVPNRSGLEAETDVPGMGSLPLFTFDGDPKAVWWTLRDVLTYLFWAADPTWTWVDSFLRVSPSIAEESARLSVDAEGLSAWAAMAAASEAAGFDLAEVYDGYNSHLVAIRRGEGTRATLKRQDLAVDGSHPPIDLRETNVFASSIADTVAPCVTRPVVLGGCDLYQVTVRLAPAWDPARLELVLTEPPDPGDDDPEEPDPDSQYARRYLPTGADFAGYADVGRLWDANADGRYSGEPWSAATPDMASLSGEAAGSWPLGPYPAHPLLLAASPKVEDPDTGETAARPASREAVLEISFDSGATWRYLDGFRCDPERLAVVLTRDNLGEVETLLEGAGDPADLFTALWEDKENATSLVRMRLTCTIASPHRRVVQPALRGSAPTGFETAECFPRGELGQRRTVAPSSAYGPAGSWEDEAEGLADLEAEAAKIQAACEPRDVSTMLALEWLEGAPGLTDVVERIDGVYLYLGLSRGPDSVYPRVVARTLDLANWSCALSLGTERKSGTRFRPARLGRDALGRERWVAP